MRFSTLFLALSALLIGNGYEVEAAPRGCRHHSVHTITRWYNAPTTSATAIAAVNVNVSDSTSTTANSSVIAEPTSASQVSDSASTSISNAFESSAAASEASSSTVSGEREDQVTSSAVATPTAASSVISAAASAIPSTSESAAAPSATGASSSVAQTMVQLHNDFRAQYGAGAVTWSDELASYAASHTTACDMEHTKGPYGENLAAGVGGGYSVTDAFNAWAAEAPEYDPSNPQYSHFTQVVWKATTEIGCAAVSCPSGSIFDMTGDSLYVMCEYNPRGNMIGAFAENVGSKTA
ncbi:hypothetical protein IAU59_003211 [Kwoniella sp. CBS 9459]